MSFMMFYIHKVQFARVYFKQFFLKFRSDIQQFAAVSKSIKKSIQTRTILHDMPDLFPEETIGLPVDSNGTTENSLTFPA